MIKLGVMMNPLTTLKPLVDTSLRMMAAATDLGWDCRYFHQSSLFCRDGRVGASMMSLQGALSGVFFLDELDVVLMRQDPPVTMEYWYALYALELVESSGVVVANKPQGIRDANEKFLILNFPSCCVPTLVTQDMQMLHDFWVEHGDVILKPLDGMGGQSIFRVDSSGVNLPVIVEMMTQKNTKTIMAQRYIPEIQTMGDKRILLVHGKPVPYALLRTPASGDIRGNLAAGATSQVVPITKHDEWLCAQISPLLLAKGLSFVGVDVIGDYITEINVTSPTGMVQIEEATGLAIGADYLQKLVKVRS